MSQMDVELRDRCREEVLLFAGQLTLEANFPVEMVREALVHTAGLLMPGHLHDDDQSP